MHSKQPNIFTAVKQAVTPRQAASFYGLKADSHGMCRCPFHDDHTPSLKLYDDHYYCFGCGAAGDVIELAGRLLGLSPLDTARRLCRDFGIKPEGYDPPDKKAAVPVLTPTVSGKENRHHRPRDQPDTMIGLTEAVRLLGDLRIIMEEIMDKYRPSDREADWSDVFTFAIRWHAEAEILQDQLLFSDREDQQIYLAESQKELEIMKEFVCRYDRRKDHLNEKQTKEF